MNLLIRGDARRIPLADKSVHCVVTSPPYFGLRDYGVTGQIGLEPSPAEFVAALVGVFREVWRVLRDDGVAFVNLGDSYASDFKGSGGQGKSTLQMDGRRESVRIAGCVAAQERQAMKPIRINHGFKPKDRMGIPHRVVFALQQSGWYWRDEIVWAKPNPMPESVTDRTTKAHEFIFMLTKQERYWYDQEAIKESTPAVSPRQFGRKVPEAYGLDRLTGNMRDGITWSSDGGRNRRSVWSIASESFPGAHFATFPRKLIEPCILAGCPAGGIVFDPFNGSGTSGVVALAHGRRYVGLDLSADYLAMAHRRIERPHARIATTRAEEPLPLFMEIGT